MNDSSESVRLVCLANSRKLGGSCFAGKEILEDGNRGPWIRPVSSREHEEVSLRECRCSDGSLPQVLDVLDVPVLSAKPRGYQQENWLLDTGRKWEKVAVVPVNSLHRFTDNVGALWSNGDSSYHGLNNRVSEAEADSFRHSLLLLRVDALVLRVFAPGANFGNSQMRVNGHFRYKGLEYRLRVTDSEYEYTYLQRPTGNYTLGPCFLTISLGEPYKGYAYKLIAGIIGVEENK